MGMSAPLGGADESQIAHRPARRAITENLQMGVLCNSGQGSRLAITSNLLSAIRDVILRVSTCMRKDSSMSGKL